MYAVRLVWIHENQEPREVTSLPKCQHVIKMIAENKLHAEPRLHFANREIKIHVYAKREFVPRDQVVPLIVVNCLLLQLKKISSFTPVLSIRIFLDSFYPLSFFQMRYKVLQGFSWLTGFNRKILVAEHVTWQNQNVTKMRLHRGHRSK